MHQVESLRRQRHRHRLSWYVPSLVFSMAYSVGIIDSRHMLRLYVRTYPTASCDNTKEYSALSASCRPFDALYSSLWASLEDHRETVCFFFLCDSRRLQCDDGTYKADHLSIYIETCECFLFYPQAPWTIQHQTTKTDKHVLVCRWKNGRFSRCVRMSFIGTRKYNEGNTRISSRYIRTVSLTILQKASNL